MIEAGAVAKVVAAFEHAITLARGTSSLTAREAPKVRREDMAAAHDFAVAIAQMLRYWHANAGRVRWGPVAMQAQAFIDAAAAAARGLQIQTETILASSPRAATEVRSLGGGWPQMWVRSMRAASDASILEVVAAERPLKGSNIGIAAEWSVHETVVETVLVFIPIVGEAVLAMELVSGYSPMARELSATERAAAALGLVLPPMVNFGARNTMRAAVITQRSLLLHMANRMLFPAMSQAQGRIFALRTAIGLRILSEAEFARLLKLVSPSATKMGVAEVNEMNFLLRRIDYLSRYAQWLSHAQAELGAKTVESGHHVLKGAVPTPVELATARLLEKHTGKRVISLPESIPETYPDLKQVTKVKYPDAIWGTELCDFKELRGGTAEAQIGYIAEKGKQANTVVVTFMKGSGLGPDDIAPHLHKLWVKDLTPPTPGGLPRGYDADLDRVIMLTDDAVRIVTRPEPYNVALVHGATKVAARRSADLVTIVRESSDAR